MSIVDNCTELDNIQITYPEKPDFNNNTEDNITVTYIAVDDSGNMSETTMKILLLKQNDTSMDLAALADKKKQEQQLIEQTNRDDGNTSNNNGGNNNNQSDPDNSWRDDNWQDTPTNDDGTHTGRNPQISADSFTWSMSRDGLYGQAFVIKASSLVHYYDYDYADATMVSGPFVSFQPDGPGTYTIHWETSTGLSCDQTVTLTE